MKTAETQRILLKFRRHLEKKRKNPNTVRSYTNDVRQFLAWFSCTYGPECDLRRIERSDIMDFRTYLQTRRASYASVNRRLTALRQFFDMCVSTGLLETNPVADIAGVPPVPSIPSILTRKEAQLLVRAVERLERPLETVIVHLLLHAGLRGSEICGLTVGDVHLTPRLGRLFIRGRRNRTMRFVMLTTRSVAALRRYLRRRGILALPRRLRAEPLLVNREGNPLTQQAVDQIVKRVGREAGIPNATPTILRNTYAVRMLLQGEPPNSVKRMLGVTSVRNHLRLVERIRLAQIPY
ncbi:MAG: tyrosine-type recombinase/integrase [Bacteroidota bacterium]|nr:tyrosine-type recombinase/integrase [Bacteroidota bacterium]